MSQTDRFSVKEAVFGIVLLAIVGGAMYYTLTLIKGEGAGKPIEISNLGDADADRIEAVAKILSIDPIKGDVTARIELLPSGTIVAEDGTLKEDLRVYVNSSNGKQETAFAKGKRLTAVEGVFTMQNGNASDYPFDSYLAEIELYITKTKPAAKKPAASPTPARDEETATPAASPTPADEDEDSNELPLSVDFEGKIPGYNIAATKAKETDESYVVIEAKIERSGIVKLFSIFVATLMWILTTGVLFLMISVVIRGRKVELAMFSFMAALLFAFYAVRNSQPNVPPIGVFSDFTSFFWVEMIVATCLVVALITWLFRSSK